MFLNTKQLLHYELASTALFNHKQLVEAWFASVGGTVFPARR